MVIEIDGSFDYGKSSGGLSFYKKPHLINKFLCPADGYPQYNFR